MGVIHEIPEDNEAGDPDRFGYFMRDYCLEEKEIDFAEAMKAVSEYFAGQQ